jgi:hypothetical protein
VNLRRQMESELRRTRSQTLKTLRRHDNAQRRLAHTPDFNFTSDPVGNWIANRVIKFGLVVLMFLVFFGISALTKH